MWLAWWKRKLLLVLVGKLEGRGPLGKPRPEQEIILKLVFKN
jgi:hypothetical protein